MRDFDRLLTPLRAAFARWLRAPETRATEHKMTIQSEIKAFLATALSDASAIEADFQSLLSSPQVAAYAPMAEAALTGFLASKGIPAAAVEQWGGAILAVLNGAAKIAAASAPVAPISTTTTVTQ